MTGVTVLLWGGERSHRSCSTRDASAAVLAAAELGIQHLVLDLTSRFAAEVVAPS